jgi:hypothetical protein
LLLIPSSHHSLLSIWPIDYCRQQQLVELILMRCGSNANAGKEEDASGGQPGNGKPPHWRRREYATTTVYVVHPTQFRTVVQQLTGAASPPPPLSSHQHAGGSGGNGAGTRTIAVAQADHGGAEQSGGTGSRRGRTLGQMYQDCLAWANADDS